MINLSIILPTLNEKDNLETLIPDLLNNLSDINNLEFEIIISDDQSNDGTKEFVEFINSKNNNICYYKRESTPSLPMSIWDGIKNQNMIMFYGWMQMVQCQQKALKIWSKS